MIIPDLILKPFADGATGGNIQAPPQTSPTGFVNFTDGYTSFYEISLAAGNPQAKAVERPIQNYLFNALTKNANAWQAQCTPPWYSGMVNGYGKNAKVMRINGGNTFIYRSLIDNNVSDPIGNPAMWEYEPTAAEMLKNVPMPSGGPAGPTAMLITAPVDFNTILAGTFEVKDATVLSASPNSPSPPYGGAFGSGLVEAITWDTGAGNITIQRFTDQTRGFAIRSGVNGTFIPWRYAVSYRDIQSAESISGNLAGGPTVYTATLSPSPPDLFMGMEVRLLVNVTSGASPTLNLNGLGAKPIVGGANSAIKAGELIAGRIVSLVYSITSGGRWCVVGQAAGPIQVSAASDALQAPQAGQVQLGAFNYAPDTTSAASPGVYSAAYAPAVTTLAYGLTLNFVAQLGNPGASTFSPNGLPAKPIVDLSNLPLSANSILAGSICQVTYSVSLDSWILMSATGAAYQQATESKAGVAKIATQALTDAGLDDTTIISPKKLAVISQSGKQSYALDTGVANACVVALTPAITSRVDGQVIRFRVKFTNTTGTTINDGLGVAPLVGLAGSGSNLEGGELVASGIATIVWNAILGAYVLQACTGAGLQVGDAGRPRQAVTLRQLATPIGTTPPQFDNTLRFATTQFVRDMGLQYSEMRVLGGNTTLVPADAGCIIIGNGGAGTLAVALPLTTLMPAGVTITIWQYASGNLNVAPNPADVMISCFGAVGAFVLRPGDSITLTSNGGGSWYVTGGTLSAAYSVPYSSSLQVNGYKRTPDVNSPTGNMIEQWGVSGVAPAGSLVNVNFPVAMSGILVSHANPVGQAVNANPGGGIGISRSGTGLTLFNWGSAINYATYWYVKGY